MLLTHRSVVSTAAALIKYLDQVKGNLGIHGGLGPNDSMLSYLPLAHIFDRIVEEFALSVGARIGYSQVCLRPELSKLCAHLGACLTHVLRKV